MHIIAYHIPLLYHQVSEHSELENHHVQREKLTISIAIFNRCVPFFLHTIAPTIASPKRSPCIICVLQHHVAIPPFYAHGNTTWQHSCSHPTTICNQAFKNRIELRTHEAPFIAEQRGGTNRAQKDRSRTRRTHEGPFIAGRSHFTRTNRRFRTPSTSQNKARATSTHELLCVLQHHVAISHLSTHMATQHGIIHAAMPLRSATKNSRTA